MKKLMSLFILITVIALACSKGGDAVTSPSGSTTVDCSVIDSRFGAVVSVIIQNSCATSSGCHSAGSVNGPGPLTNYTQVKAAANEINASVAAGRMPKGSSLSTAQKNAISCWVSSGALNN